jgi:hypothetical protein
MGRCEAQLREKNGKSLFFVTVVLIFGVIQSGWDNLLKSRRIECEGYREFDVKIALEGGIPYES